MRVFDLFTRVTFECRFNEASYRWAVYQVIHLESLSSPHGQLKLKRYSEYYIHKNLILARKVHYLN